MEFRIWVANSFPPAKIETVSAGERPAPTEKDYLILKRASVSRPSGEWGDDDFDVLSNGTVVGRIFKVHAAPVGSPWMWTLAFGYQEDRTPTHPLRCDPRGRDGSVREELAAGVE